MKKFMYFADGNGANLSGEAYVAEAESVAGIYPVTTTTTAVYFSKSDETRDKIVFTHDDTTNGVGHRCKDIGKAIAEAANAGPHTNGMVDVIDLDNKIYLGNLSFVTALAVTLDTTVDFTS